MVNQTNTKQTVQMIEQAMLRLKAVIADLTSDNPQVVVLRNRNIAELDVLTAVHQSLNGNHIDLRLYV
jgi:ribosomal protein L4